PQHRELIEAAAVLGESSSVDLLTSVASASQEQAYESLREVVTLGLLDESNDGKTIVFPQTHLREAIYNAMTERHRTELHQRVAEALEPALQAGSAHFLGQVAFHYARAGDQSKGVRYSVEAGDMAMSTIAHQGATDFYRSALELMDLAGAEEARKAEVREKLADAYHRSGDYRGAIQAYQFLLKSIQARSKDEAPNAGLARVMKKIGKVLGKRGDQEAALSYFQNAIDQFEKLGMSIEVAELLNRIAGLHRERDDSEAARASSERALQLLDASDPNIVFGYVMNMLGLIEYSLGNWQKSRTMLMHALKVGEKVGSERLCKVASTNLGNTLWKLGDWINALQYYKMNLALSESEGDLWDLITAYNNIGIIEFSRGDFQVAAGYFEKSVRIDEKIGAVEYEALARENLAEAFEMLGRWNDALAQYNRCLALQGFDDARASRSSVYIPL
ncbi:MAG: tetratricopeptide repeat protein, partial [Thermoanaerobaculia bacterium]